jgi:hypothetical protein
MKTSEKTSEYERSNKGTLFVTILSLILFFSAPFIISFIAESAHGSSQKNYTSSAPVERKVSTDYIECIGTTSCTVHEYYYTVNNKIFSRYL